MFICIPFIPSFLLTAVEGRLSLLRVAGWHKEKLQLDQGKVKRDGYHHRGSLTSIATNFDAIREDMRKNSPFYEDMEREEFDLETDASEDVSQVDELIEHERFEHELAHRKDAKRALHELLAFGMPATYPQSFMHSFSFDFSTSFSFDFSMSFSLDTEILTSFPSEFLVVTDEPTISPEVFDFFLDLSDDVSLSMDITDGGTLAPDPSPSSQTPSKAPTTTLVPTFFTPIPTTGQQPTLSSSTAAPNAPSNVSVDGKNAGDSPSPSPVANDGPDVPNIEDGSGTTADGINQEDFGSNDSASSSAVQATMIAVLVGAAVAVGAALFAWKWYRTNRGGLSGSLSYHEDQLLGASVADNA